MKQRVPWLAALPLLSACSGPDASLGLSPPSVPHCGLPAEIVVHWDASGLTDKNITVEVAALGQPAVLWANEPPRASKRTERWVDDGHTFILRDEQGTELVRRTFTTAPCPVDESQQD